MRIYTRTGDEGETGLFGGGRVSKDDPRVAAYGDVDELNSVLGLVRSTPPIDLLDDVLEGIQRDLFAIGGHLATPDPGKVRKAIATSLDDSGPESRQLFRSEDPTSTAGLGDEALFEHPLLDLAGFLFAPIVKAAKNGARA